MSVKIIAEAGVNHNGNLSMAKRMVDVAAKAGADYIKFQTFRADELVTTKAPKAAYQKKNTKNKENQYQMLKKLELSQKNHFLLKKYCKKKNITFLSSAFGIESFNFLIKLGLKTIKIPSGEINNLPFLKHIGKFRKKLVISTGMATLREIKKAVEILVKLGTSKKNLTLLHCNTDYPTSFSDVNLKAMTTIKEQCNAKVGYSDHSLGTIVPICAVALGAEVIEKHFTLNKNLSGPDHKSSLEPHELSNMIKDIRKTEKILGNGLKKPSLSELKNIKIVRKSIVAKIDIKKGDIFSKKNLITKRPGNGISPMYWDKLVGKKSTRKFKKDDLIRL